MDIKIDKLISGSNGTLACVSDETILAVGKRYFELASGKESIKETPKAVDVVEAAKELDKARQAGHGCDACKHNRKIITEEPCSSCDICLGNNKWEPKDN